jgi:hypothetical protein
VTDNDDRDKVIILTGFIMMIIKLMIMSLMMQS